MKTLITIASLLILSHTSMSQIKIPNKNKKIKTKVDFTVNTIAVPIRIDANKFSNLKPEQVAKLPAATYHRSALLNLKINKSWEITPSRFSDKDMHVVEYFGKYQKSQHYISIYPENKYYSRINNGGPGFLPEMRYLILKFNPQMGERYRMVIKLKPGEYRNKKIMTNVTGRYNDTWYINYQYNEVMFDFVASSKEIKISPVIAGSESYYVKYEPLEIEKIKIDKVED